MTIEKELQKILVSDHSKDNRFERQLNGFQKLEKRLTQGGYVIEKKKFSIPLMERLSTANLKN